MNPLKKPSMTVDEFLIWGEKQERGRYELQDGEIVVMQSERAAHWRATYAGVKALERAIEKAGIPCHAEPDGATVRITDRTAFAPDALVYCGDEVDDLSMEVPNPVIVVEVLSPSTTTRDLLVKLNGYFTLPSVHHYLIVDTDQRHVIHYERTDSGEPARQVLSDGSLALSPPGLSVAIADFFLR